MLMKIVSDMMKRNMFILICSMLEFELKFFMYLSSSDGIKSCYIKAFEKDSYSFCQSTLQLFYSRNVSF